MAVLAGGSRNRVDRIAAVVGAIALLVGVVAIAVGAFTPAATTPPTAISTTVVASPIPGDPVTQTVRTTDPPFRPNLPPRVTEEVTVSDDPDAGSVTVTTSPFVPAAEPPFLGSRGAVILVQLLLATLVALLLAFATQRVLLGEYWGRRVAPVGAASAPIDEDAAAAVKQDVANAGETPDLSRPLFEATGVTDARLRLLQSRIALELEVRKLAQDHDLPANLSIPAVVGGLVEKKRMTAKLGSGITALSELGDRLGEGAEITPDAVTLLSEGYAQALAKIGGKVKR